MSSMGFSEPKNSTMKDDVVLQPGTDVESGSNEDGREELKRNMEARHINMIAIAGMIVCCIP
jgi:amino acid permease